MFRYSFLIAALSILTIANSALANTRYPANVISSRLCPKNVCNGGDGGRIWEMICEGENGTTLPGMDSESSVPVYTPSSGGGCLCPCMPYTYDQY